MTAFPIALALVWALALLAVQAAIDLKEKNDDRC